MDDGTFWAHRQALMSAYGVFVAIATEKIVKVVLSVIVIRNTRGTHLSYCVFCSRVVMGLSKDIWESGTAADNIYHP